MLLARRNTLQVKFAVIASMLLLAACNTGSSSPPAAPAATLQSIAVTPPNPNVLLLSTLQLTATGTYSDSTTQNITTAVTWNSASPAVATVGAGTGLVTVASAATAGQTAVITATSGTLTGTTTVTATAPTLLPKFDVGTVTDPLATKQWGLLNTGQTGYADTTGTANTTGTLGTDINANPVYTTYGYSGLGVLVAVVDTGLEIAHEDLSENVVAGGSWEFNFGTTDPTNTTATTGDHGTSVSGLIAMAMNGKGGIGVAPKAKLKGFNLLSATSPTYAFYVAALGGSPAGPKSDDVFIFNQSYGYVGTTDSPMNTTLEAQYASGTTTLRAGKGALYVKSAGNGFKSFNTTTPAYCTGATGIGVSCQNANFDPSNTLPYNIVMAALNAKGTKSSYSTAGSAVWTSTPGGEYGHNVSVDPGLIAVAYDPAMVTTDQSACATGYSRTAATSSAFNQGGATNVSGINLSCNYTNTMNGTSSAAPMMSGAIALILEANPALTWREVKDILARTAVQVNSEILPINITSGMTGASVGTPYVAEQAWVTNAANFKFHNWYGFGAVNASAAVNMAKTYVSGSLGTFANTGWIDSGPISLDIPDNSITGVTRTLTVPSVGTSGIVEAVQIKVTAASLSSGYTGDLGIELTSPSGTKSILKNIQDGFNGSNLAGMVLASNAFYGETSLGTNGTGIWTVKVVDGWSVGTETLTNVQIRVYGH